MGLRKVDEAKRKKMINFCNAIICIAGSESTFEGDAIKELALEVANWIESLEPEDKG